jgi:hypothetical protein
MKNALLIVAGFLALFLSVSVFILYQSDDVSQEEGFLYSAIGCTSLYKKLEEPEKVDHLLNLVHSFSEKQHIENVQPGYISRFIKLVEKKWEKENDLTMRNCSGIYSMALNEEKPDQYNKVTQSVIEYLHDLERKKH